MCSFVLLRKSVFISQDEIPNFSLESTLSNFILLKFFQGFHRTNERNSTEGSLGFNFIWTCIFQTMQHKSGIDLLNWFVKNQISGSDIRVENQDK